jgi:hypothetical protein
MNNWLLVTVALCSIPPRALADDTLKFREVAHQVSVQSWQVGDIDGHAIFPGACVGNCLFSRRGGWHNFPDCDADYVEDSGAIPLSYDNLTLSDGSVPRLKGA